VSGIGKERQRSGPPRPDELGEHVEHRQEQNNAQSPPAFIHVPVIVMRVSHRKIVPQKGTKGTKELALTFLLFVPFVAKER
jgi:hypothetical protein